MLRQILLHTPAWVWAVLAFLLYRGLLASADREIALKKTLLIPVVMLGLSLQGMASAFGTDMIGLPAWFGCMLAGTALAWRAFNGGSMTAYPARGTVFLRGSWAPLALMMGIFCTKYTVGVLLALHPGLRQSALFSLGVCAAYGLFNGIFIGKALRVLATYRLAAAGDEWESGGIRQPSAENSAMK